MEKDIFKMTPPEQNHVLWNNIRALADYWNRASVDRCDIYKAIELKNQDDIDFLSERLKQHVKISIELVDSIKFIINDMNAFELCKREQK